MKIQIIALTFVTFVVGGCATTSSTKAPPSSKGDSVSSSTTVPTTASQPTPAPTYNERATAMNFDQVRSSCPQQDSQWESMSWERLLPFANACVKAREWHRVEKMGDYLAKKNPIAPWGAFYLALSAEARRDHSRAIWMLELAIKKDPKEGIFHYELGRIHWEMGEAGVAVKHLKEASEKNESLTDAHWILGQMALNRQDNSQARIYLKKALESSPKYFPAVMSMAQLELTSKNWAEAEVLLNKAIDLNPRSTKARVALAGVLEENLKKLPEALSNYKEIKSMLASKKLDETPLFNVDDKIQALTNSIKQTNAASKVTSRQPSEEGKVAK